MVGLDVLDEVLVTLGRPVGGVRAVDPRILRHPHRGLVHTGDNAGGEVLVVDLLRRLEFVQRVRVRIVVVGRQVVQIPLAVDSQLEVTLLTLVG